MIEVVFKITLQNIYLYYTYFEQYYVLILPPGFNTTETGSLCAPDSSSTAPSSRIGKPGQSAPLTPATLNHQVEEVKQVCLRP